MRRLAEEDSPKKSYEPPVLTMYGTVHHVTKHNRQGTQLDGGQPPQGQFTGLG